MSCGSIKNTGKEIRGKSENRFRRGSRVLYRKVSVYIPDISGRDTARIKRVRKGNGIYGKIPEIKRRIKRRIKPEKILGKIPEIKREIKPEIKREKIPGTRRNLSESLYSMRRKDYMWYGSPAVVRPSAVRGRYAAYGRLSLPQPAGIRSETADASG